MTEQTPAPDIGGIAKEVLAISAISLLLSIMLLGMKTLDRPSGLELQMRWDLVLAAVLSTGVGRVALILRRLRRMAALHALLLGAAVCGYVELALRFRELKNASGEPDRWIGLQLSDHPLFVIGLFVGVVVIACVSAPKTWSAQRRQDEETPGFGEKIKQIYLANTRNIGILGLAFFVALPLVFNDRADRALIDLATLVLIYVMLGWGLNIVVGLAGLLDLGYVAFYAVGAYSYALLAIYYDLSFWLCLPLAGLFAATFGIILGFPVLRLRGDYLAIVTLGFGEIIRVVLLNWYDFTGGPDGISSIPRPSFFGLAEFTRRAQEGVTAFHDLFGIDFDSMHRVTFLYYLILILALLTNWFTMRIRRLPVGRAWEALREDEIACRSLGINPTNTKLSAFAIGAMFGGFAGAFFATRQGFISPESFTFIESAVILAVVVLGGMGSQIGVVLAAVIMIGLPEWFRQLEEYRMLLFGGGMFAIMIWKPRGLLAFRDPTLLLHGKHTAGEGARK